MTHKKEKFYIRIISYLAVFTLLFGITTVLYAKKADRYEFANEINNQRAINELCESLDSITVSLQKSLYSGTRDMLRDIGNDLCRQAVVAKESLSELTPENSDTEEIFKFLSQVGDYTVSLSQSEDNMLFLSAEDRLALRSLYEYSDSLSESLTQILSDYNNSAVSFTEKIRTVNLDESELPESFSVRMENTKQTLTDYPTLLYDGPFSDSILRKESAFLKNKKEITKDEAKKLASKILGEDISSLREDADVNSAISLYCFSVGDKSASVTKKGGYLCNLTAESQTGAATISEKEATDRGEDFLDELGFDSMEESYYSVYDGICTVNFSYEEDGITYYSDLIKVSISLETGRPVGFDARGYLMNHHERKLPKISTTKKGAENIISDSLTILSSKKALIPLETGKEALCYEFRCRDRDKNECLVYVNCATGKEQDIMLLLYEDGGVLVR